MTIRADKQNISKKNLLTYNTDFKLSACVISTELIKLKHNLHNHHIILEVNLNAFYFWS
jgi:hypothetical protein